jgi:hydroxyacylglutathione hydrolase
MRVVIVPLNDDNYGYLLIDETSNECAIIDVSGQPEEILKHVEKEGVVIIKVLTTHKHWDHAGGNNKIKVLHPNLEIVGSLIDNVEGCTTFVEDGQMINVSGIAIRCILTPGHTMGHMSYYAEHNNEKAVFTGDCLFVGGVGKFFEGTAADMYVSLYEKLGRLPPETLIYCGHEYTLSNYRFALSVDNENMDLINANKRAVILRREGKPTIPSTILAEIATNPFFRATSESLQKSCGFGSSDPIQVLHNIREGKNNFK